MEILFVLFIIVGLLGLCFSIGSVLYLQFEWFKFFYHDCLQWHIPDNLPQYFDGCSLHSTCKHCGKVIMQDSQGNWF